MQDNNKIQNETNTYQNMDLSSMSMYNASGSNPNSKRKIILVLAGLSFVFIIASIIFYFIFYKNKSNQVTPNKESVNFPDLSNKKDTEFYSDKNSNNSNSNNQSGEINEIDRSPLVHIWTKPVLTFAHKKDKKVEIISSEILTQSTNTESKIKQETIEKNIESVYFVDKASGNIYRSEYPEYKAERISKTEIKLVDQAVFDYNVEYLATLKDGNLVVDKVSNVEDGIYNIENKIDQKVKNVYSDGFDSNFIYTKNENGGLGLYVFETKKNITKRIGFVPLTNVKILWQSKDSLYVITAPSDEYKQNILSYSLATGKLSDYIVNAGDNIFSDSDIIYTQETSLNYKNINGKIIDLQKNTFADKCVFVGKVKVICAVPNTILSTNINYWYMGATSFTDSFYYFDILSGVEKNFFDHSLVSGENIDTYNIIFKDNQLIFQNKTDESLWSLDSIGLI